MNNKELYYNAVLEDIDGSFLCYVGKDKYDWYIRKNIAEEIENKRIRLKSKARGPGVSKKSYYSLPKKNICVCCGSESNLSKHHVVPKCFRKNFPSHKKEHLSHDVVLLCRKCHDIYESHAQKKKDEICRENGVFSRNVLSFVDNEIFNKEYFMFRSALKCYLNAKKEDKKNKYKEIICNYLNVKDISDLEINFINKKEKLNVLKTKE